MIKQLRTYQLEALTTLRKRLKEVTHPLLVTASVGAGKSLIIAELLLIMERVGFNALCLTLNSTLIQQNAHAYELQGGHAGIYCAGLHSKSFKEFVIFGSPHSVLQSIRNKEEISRKKFNIIIVDEAHNISPNDESTMFRRILNHYGRMAQEEQYSFRVVGLTGTPYRGKGISVAGKDQFFKEEVCNISTSWLISQGFLTKPVFGLTSKSIDFSALRVNNMGQFNGKELQSVVDKNVRLTGEIMQELQQLECNGIFIFSSTKRHCEECARSLPDGTWAIITGETKHEDRAVAIQAAREGRLRYIISVGCVYVGVDIPFFDVCAWLRPTESLVIYTQGIGRVLRLHPGKIHARILDYAGNLERHGDIDDPIINEALQPKDPDDPDYCIPCFTCNTLNKVTTRRCIGQHNGRRCEHYFEFKACHQCGVENDIVSRQCRSCQAELIDPNTKLTRIKAETFTFTVQQATYGISQYGNAPMINVCYICDKATVYESYFTNSEKARNITYAKFVRNHVDKASDYYMKMRSVSAMKQMIESPNLKTPKELTCTIDETGRYKIIKKVF